MQAGIRSLVANAAVLAMSTAGFWLVLELAVFPDWIHHLSRRSEVFPFA